MKERVFFLIWFLKILYTCIWDSGINYENMGFEQKPPMAVFQKAEKAKTAIGGFWKTKKNSCISVQRTRKKQKPPLALFEKLKTATGGFSFPYPCTLTYKPIFLYISHLSTILKIKNLNWTCAYYFQFYFW